MLLGYTFVAAPLVWPLGMMLIAWTSRRAWATLGLGVAGGLAIWFLTMPVVLWLGARVSARGLLPAWATSFGLVLMALGTSLGLAVPAALNLGFPEPGTGAAGRRR